MTKSKSARRRAISAGLIALALAWPIGSLVSAAGAPPVKISLTVKSFTTNASVAVPLGTEVLVTMVGSPGDRAYFSIPNVVERTEMTEVSGGVYLGKYVIGAGHDVDGAAVIGELIAPDATASPVFCAARHITIDTVRPKLVDMFPGDGDNIASPRPVCYCGYDDEAGSGVDLRTVKVQVDGYDVTKESSISNSGVSYQPPADLAVGTHTFYVSIQDAAGNPAESIRRFQVVKHGVSAAATPWATGPRVLAAGDSLIVTVNAEPGASADMSIPPLPGTIRLHEINPGLYSGKFVAAAGDSLVASPVIVCVNGPDGKWATCIDHPVTISAGVPAPPRIALSGDQDELSGQVEFSGRAPVGALVKCTLSYDSRSQTGIMPFSGNALTAMARADEKSQWRMGPFRLNLKSLYGRNIDTRMRLSAVTVSPDGGESQPDVESVAYAP